LVICLERDLHMAQLMPLPLTVSCFSKIRIGFTFRVVPDKGPLNVCVCGGCGYRLVGLWRENWPHEGLWTASNTGRLSVVNNELMAGLSLLNSYNVALGFFTARCYASAVLAMALCPSVCLSVRPSQVGVLLKRLNVGSHKQHHTIVQGL